MPDQQTLDRPAAAALNSELEDYRQQLEATKQEAESLLAGLTEAQFNWRPEAGRWSIAECLAHLNTTNRLYAEAIDHSLERARARQLFSDGPFRYGFLGSWFVRSIEPPPRRRFKAPKVFAPPPQQSRASVAAEFMKIHDEILKRLQHANGIDLVRARVISPVTSLFRLSLGQSFALIAAHNRRHLWQARQVKEHPDFPRT